MADVFAEQNAIAAGGDRRKPASVKVRMLKDRVINGPDHKTLGLCVAGRVVETAPDYANILVESGVAEFYTEEVPPPPPAPARARRVPTRKRHSKSEP